MLRLKLIHISKRGHCKHFKYYGRIVENVLQYKITETIHDTVLDTEQYIH